MTPLLPSAGVDPRPRLLIVGCSTRAAAWSAIRAGFRPVCSDQFGDEDLRQVAEVVDEPFTTPASIFRGPQTVSAAVWAVTDHLTAELARLDHLSANHGRPITCLVGPRLSNSLKTVRQCADLPLLSTALQAADLPVLEYRVASNTRSEVPAGRTVRECPPRNGEWIVKKSHGGGRDVRFWNDQCDLVARSATMAFQEFKPGLPMSAIFIGRDDGVGLLGLTQQLIGDPVASPPWSFGYCGNIAPISLPESGQELIVRMAAAIARQFELRGLFGLDFIWDGRTPWVVEVNPRYTASCELLELAYGQSLLTEHWSCFVSDPPPQPPMVPARRGGLPDVVGKLILYARRPVTAPDLSRFLSLRSPWSVPFLADIPRIGTPFEPGQPLCTVFATGHDTDAVRRKLDRRAARVRRWFGDADAG